MRNGLIVCLALFAGICLPATASAASKPYLTLEAAKFNIEVFEYLSWENYGFSMIVHDCDRYNRTHISCLARWELNEYLYFSRDYVTLLNGDHYRVDPGNFELIAA